MGCQLHNTIPIHPPRKISICRGLFSAAPRIISLDYWNWAICNPVKHIWLCIALYASFRLALAGGNISHWLNPLWPWFF